MEINILGSLEIGPPWRPPDLRRAKERSLLAVFAISAGEIITSEALIHRVWDDDSPSGATARALRTYLTRVREVIAAADGTRHALRARPLDTASVSS